MTDNVTQMADYSNSGMQRTPVMLLEALLKQYNEEKPEALPNKLLIIPLRDGEDMYDVGFSQCGMSMSECIALMEVAKTLFLNQMNYNVLPEDL